MTAHPRLVLSLAIVLALAANGCAGALPVAPARPGKKPAAGKPASAKPAAPASQLAALGALEKLVVPQAGQQATLTGKVKLISNRGGAIISDNGGGIISDNGGGIISDNGGGIISNNGGTIISNNGGTIISDNGGGIVSNNGGTIVSNNGGTLSKAGYRLAQAAAGPAQAKAGLAVFRLADALVTLHDARGRLLVDEAGEPLMATTDKDGGYTLQASLPPGNLVARIRLWNGGELSAMVARDGAGQLTLDLDTASTMGAAYVLGQFVKGDQAIFDKLPRRENERLTRELDAVRGYLKGAFKYDARLLTEATDALRARVPAVDQTIEDVKALLLGQARLGGGRLATEVPLGDPRGLVLDKDGNLLVAESLQGRVRTIDPRGQLATLVDGAFGRVQRNFVGASDLVAGPDGTFWVASPMGYRVWRVKPDGQVDVVLGTGGLGRDPLGDPQAMKVVPRTLALGPDGTLYVGEDKGPVGAKELPPRVLALSPDGAVKVVPVKDWGQGGVNGLAVGPDGALYVLFKEYEEPTGTVYRHANGATTALATGLALNDNADLALGADGTVYVAEDEARRVVAIAPAGGAARPVGGAGAAGAAASISLPSSLGAAPDGTLYVGDQATNLVWAIARDGTARVIAGTQATLQSGDTTAFAINTPGGIAFDAQGRLLIAEGGSHTIKRFADSKLEVIAGSVAGSGGDGGPAVQAKLFKPTGLAMREGALWVLDSGNRTLRVIAPDGTISTRAGMAFGQEHIAPGGSLPAAEVDLRGALGLAFGQDGRPYWTNAMRKQIQRLSPGTPETVDHVAGLAATDVTAGLFADPNATDPAKVGFGLPFGIACDAGGDLFVSDPGTMQIRRITGLGTGAVEVRPFAGLALADLLAKTAAVGPDNPMPSEEGLAAREAGLVLPTGLAFDAAGNLYVGEAGTTNAAAFSALIGVELPLDLSAFPTIPARVRKIAPDGTITTIAGPGGKFFKAPKAEDALVLPAGIAVAPDGRLVIVDAGANLVRILPAGSY